MQLRLSLLAARHAISTRNNVDALGWLRSALAEANRLTDAGTRSRMRSRIVTAMNHVRGL